MAIMTGPRDAWSGWAARQRPHRGRAVRWTAIVGALAARADPQPGRGRWPYPADRHDASIRTSAVRGPRRTCAPITGNATRR